MGAMALFGEKYGDTVRVVTIGNPDHTESVELCGGTHLHSTGQAGSFVILSESGIAAGTRRIEAATGWNALKHARAMSEELHQLAAMLKTQPGGLSPSWTASRRKIAAPQGSGKGRRAGRVRTGRGSHVQGRGDQRRKGACRKT